MKGLFTLLLSLFIANGFGQASENFNKPSLSSGTLACWRSSNLKETSCGKLTVPPYAIPLSTDPAISLNTSTPITGSASLHIENSAMAPDGACFTSSSEAIYSLGYGVDGNTVSFDLRINSLVFPVSNTAFSVSVSCGNFFQSFPYTPTDVGSIIPIATTIIGSNGGGVITISLSIGTSSFASSASYSADIDNFATIAGLDPDNACLQALPVTFIGFTAQKENQQAKLVWATSVEQNSKGFDIQRSTDARQWKSVGFVNSQQANSDARINYSWYDELPLAGSSYYRLRQVDLDGSSQFSKIQAVSFPSDGQITLYPNPVTDRLFIRNLSAEKIKSIHITDATGRIVQATLGDDGIDMSCLSTGIYYLHLLKVTGATQVQKLTKQ